MSSISTTTIGSAKLGANDTINFGGSGSYGDVSTEQLYHSLVDILGPPRRGMEWNNNMGYKMTHEDLPDLWRDKVTYLGERIEGTTVKSRLAVTTIIAPIHKIKGARIDWSTWTFDVASAVPRILPHEGIPPIAQYSERRDTRRMERKGHSMIFELPAMDSPEGKVRYNRGMLGMSAAVIYGIVYDTLWNLLWPAREEIEEKAKLTARDLSILRMHRFEREQFAGFNKSKEGFAEVVKRLSDAMIEISDGAAPWVLVPPGTAARFGTSELQRVTHVELDATQSFLKAVNGKTDDMFSFDGKTHIVEMPGMSILTTDGEKPIRDLFLRQKMMLHHATNAETEASIEHGFAQNSRAAPTPNAQRTVYIYGSGSQKKEPITPLKALRKSRLYNPDGSLPPLEMVKPAEANNKRLTYAEACGLDPKTGEYHDDADESIPRRAVHPFFRYDEEKDGLKPVDYTIECDPSACSKDWFKLGGDAVLNKAKVSEEAWDALVEYIDQCENGESTPGFWQALIQANAASSVNAAGEFVGVTAGALAPEAVRTMDYDPNHVLWSPGPTGILRLPIVDGTYQVPAHPVGFGSAAGLAAIANASASQAFGNMAGEAKAHLATLTKMYAAVRYMPNNPLIKRKFQALFNIGTDNRNAMLNNALASVRHGVYLPYLKKNVDGAPASGFGRKREVLEEVNDLAAMDLSFADIVDNNRRLTTAAGKSANLGELFAALGAVAAGYNSNTATPSGGTAVRLANGSFVLLPRAMAANLGVTPALAQLSRFGPRVGRAFSAIAYALSLDDSGRVLLDDSETLNNFSVMLYESCTEEQAQYIVLGLLANLNMLDEAGNATADLDALAAAKGAIEESVTKILADHKTFKSTGKVKKNSALQGAVKAGGEYKDLVKADAGEKKPVQFASKPDGDVRPARNTAGVAATTTAAAVAPGVGYRLVQATGGLYTAFNAFVTARRAANDDTVYVINLLGKKAGTIPAGTTDVEDALDASPEAVDLKAALVEARGAINDVGTGGRIARASNVGDIGDDVAGAAPIETASQVRYTLEDLDKATWYLAPGIQLGPGAAKHILFSSEAFPVRLADKVAPRGAHTQPYSATAVAGDDYMLNPDEAPEMVPLMSSSVFQPGQLHAVAHNIRGASHRAAAKASGATFSGGVQRFGDSYGTSGAEVSPMDFFDDDEVMPELDMPSASGARPAMPLASGPIRGSEEARKVHCAFTSRNAHKHMADLHDMGLTALQAAAARLVMGTSVASRQDLERLLQAGLDVPVRFLYFRYPEFVTGNGVIVLGNGECCINAQGPVQTSMSRTGVDMMVSVMMAYSGALVMLNGRKKAVLSNMFLAGLAGGLTTELADDLASIIDVDDKKRPSVLAYAIPVAQRKGLFMHELSPTGFVPQATGETEMNFGAMPQFATAGFYNRLDNTGARQGAFTPVDYINYFKQAGAIPRISDPTETWHFNNQTGYFDNVDPNQDGLGQSGYAAGSNPVYEGSATQTFFPTVAEYGSSMTPTAQLLV